MYIIVSYMVAHLRRSCTQAFTHCWQRPHLGSSKPQLQCSRSITNASSSISLSRSLHSLPPSPLASPSPSDTDLAERWWFRRHSSFHFVGDIFWGRSGALTLSSGAFLLLFCELMFLDSLAPETDLQERSANDKTCVFCVFVRFSASCFQHVCSCALSWCVCVQKKTT